MRKILNRTLKIGSVILLISGVLDITIFLLFKYHAPSWVLGITWISMAALLLAISKMLQV